MLVLRGYEFFSSCDLAFDQVLYALKLGFHQGKLVFRLHEVYLNFLNLGTLNFREALAPLDRIANFEE